MMCPCSSNAPFGECCQKLPLGKIAKRSEQFMRSHYSAFVVQNIDYIKRNY
ncbi:YchJ family metal-binding protein [Moraxella boevrei]|uniref:YchJ family metal-binding protein n=1 Tax=Faucicola boevrei TaxID=346665 RepID=UPI0037364509